MEQNCNILTPTLMAITAFLSRSPGLLNRGPWGPASLGHVLIPTSYHQLIELPVHRVIWLFNVHLLVGVTNRTHSTRPRSRLYSDIPRPDAPVICTGVFPILTAWPGRRSIYNIIFLLSGLNLQPLDGFTHTHTHTHIYIYIYIYIYIS